MIPSTCFTHVQTLDLLVAFADLSGFARIARTQDAAQTFAFIDAFAARVESVIAPAGGTVVKIMGDAALIIFNGEDASPGVRALHSLKTQIDAWLTAQSLKSELIIKAHWGPAACGPLGPQKHLDVMGETVNIAAMTPSSGIAITPDLFRRLTPAERQLFKKHTPPVTYIGLAESHRQG